MDLKIYLKKSSLTQQTTIYTHEQILNTLTNPASTASDAQKQGLQRGQILGHTTIASDNISRSLAALETIMEFIVEHFELDDILNILEEQIDAEIKLVKKE